MPQRRIELSRWKFNLDQNEYGESAGWALPDYDDSRWTEVDSYTSWETYEYAMRDYEGCAWFRTHFDYTGIPFGILRFDGIGGCAKVFVNGKYVGGTNNRYVPFDLNIRSFLKAGDNVVAILVDNSCLGEQHITGCRTTEWVLYGGLTHRVYFEEQPSVYIPHMRIDARYDGSAEVTVTVENRMSRPDLLDFAGSLEVFIDGFEAQKQVQIIECPKSSSMQLVFSFKPEGIIPWSPETPALYHLNAVLYKDGKEHYRVTERFGFRTIQVEGTKFLLNGEEILLKGVNRYDEYEPYGICPPEDVIREEFKKIKKCGFNLIRTHYPQDPIHYRLADEMGLMYMIEVPVNWWKPRENETFADYCTLAAEAVQTLDATFKYFCNHPCWTIWSTGNECYHSHPACQEMFRMLAARMRKLNPGRLITYAANQPLQSEHELDFCDFLSMNYYSGSLAEHVDQFPEQLTAVLEKKLGLAQKLYPNVPHVMTEFGYVSIRGVHGSLQEGRYAEDFGVTYLTADCAEFLKDPQMKGLMLWSWADYRHRRGFVPGKFSMGFQATYGPYGLVTIDRKPKEMLLETMSRIMKDWKLDE